MNKSVGIIIPTTGSNVVKDAIDSALNQTYENILIYLVVDGYEYKSRTNDIINQYLNQYILENPKLRVYYLHDNTGKDGRNGHNIYSAFSFLATTDYIAYLDQDNFIDETHIECCVNTIEENNLDWTYSLRKIVSENKEYICNDDCESLGIYRPVMDYNLVDTSCYCLKRDIAILCSPYFIGGFGHDRRYLQVLLNNFKNTDCTGKYTVNYRLGGNNTLTGDFFKHWNKKVEEQFNGNLPWRK